MQLNSPDLTFLDLMNNSAPSPDGSRGLRFNTPNGRPPFQLDSQDRPTSINPQLLQLLTRLGGGMQPNMTDYGEGNSTMQQAQPVNLVPPQMSQYGGYTMPGGYNPQNGMDGNLMQGNDAMYGLGNNTRLR